MLVLVLVLSLKAISTVVDVDAVASASISLPSVVPDAAALDILLGVVMVYVLPPLLKVETVVAIAVLGWAEEGSVTDGTEDEELTGLDSAAGGFTPGSISRRINQVSLSTTQQNTKTKGLGRI